MAGQITREKPIEVLFAQQLITAYTPRNDRAMDPLLRLTTSFRFILHRCICFWALKLLDFRRWGLRWAQPAGDFSLCYLHYIGRRYRELLDRHGFLTGSVRDDAICMLAVHYQFFREVLFALELGGTFALLCDEGNPNFVCAGSGGGRGLWPLLLWFAPENLRHRLALASLQEVVRKIRRSRRHDWVEEFEKKYGRIAAN